MITLNDISILIVTRVNDPKRIDSVYKRIRKYYDSVEIIIVYDAVNHNIDTPDAYLKQIVTSERVYVSGGYNLAIKSTTKKCFVFLHDDTFIHKDFINNLIPHLSNPKTICNFTTVEPPMFGNIDVYERPIQNFGFNMDDLDLHSFDEFCDARNKNCSVATTKNEKGGFFMAGHVSTLIDIGGFDERFKPFFFEDSDLMFRLHLKGVEFIQVFNSLVYHLVSLTSRKSEDGEFASKTTETLFLKKWKVPFHILETYTMIGKITYKNFRVVLSHKNIKDNKLISHLNKFFYEKTELPYSVLHIDGDTFTNEDMQYIYTLPYIALQNGNSYGKFKLNNMILEINPESIYEPNIIENIL